MSLARAGMPSAPKSAVFGKRVGHDSLATRTQRAIAWSSMTRLSAGRQSSYGIPHGSLMAVVSAARTCKSLVVKLELATQLAKATLVFQVGGRSNVRTISCAASRDLPLDRS